jgi:hypothetical protein
MKQLGNPLDMFEHLFAELPAELKKQKEELIGELAAQGGEVAND